MEFIIYGTAHQLRTAATCSEALDLLRTEVPDLVLLDLLLDDENGLEIGRFIQKQARFAQTKIVILSSLPASQMQEIGRALGAADVMEKPYSPRHLLAVVDQLLDDRPLRVYQLAA